MIKGLMEYTRKWVNAFPSNAGIGTYSPSNIIDGSQNIDCNRKRITYGAYAQVYTGTTNDMQPRTTPAISLHESNAFDGQYFMSLVTGRRIHGKKWTQLPIDDIVIEKIESIAVKERQPVLQSNIPMFELSLGLEIDLLPIHTDNTNTDT